MVGFFLGFVAGYAVATLVCVKHYTKTKWLEVPKEIIRDPIIDPPTAPHAVKPPAHAVFIEPETIGDRFKRAKKITDLL